MLWRWYQIFTKFAITSFDVNNWTSLAVLYDGRQSSKYWSWVPFNVGVLKPDGLHESVFINSLARKTNGNFFWYDASDSFTSMCKQIWYRFSAHPTEIKSHSKWSFLIHNVPLRALERTGRFATSCQGTLHLYYPTNCSNTTYWLYPLLTLSTKLTSEKWNRSQKGARYSSTQIFNSSLLWSSKPNWHHLKHIGGFVLQSRCTSEKSSNHWSKMEIKELSCLLNRPLPTSPCLTLTSLVKYMVQRGL